MQNGLVSAKALDDRSGCAAVIRALELIKDKDCEKNVTVMFSSTEEIGCRGAKTGAYTGDYDEAIAVDVTWASDCPGTDPADTGLVKLVAEKGTGRILGCQIMAPRATDMIAEIAAVMERALDEALYAIAVWRGRGRA